MDIFIADSNFFIQAHRIYYPFDVVPGFWNRIKSLAESGALISIDKVRDEIVKNKDELCTWCEENLSATFFVNTEEVISQYAEVANWANSRRSYYKPAALDEFLSTDEADAWLIAYALVDPTQRIIVTHEIRQPQRLNKIKIPDACEPFGIQHLMTSLQI